MLSSINCTPKKLCRDDLVPIHSFVLKQIPNYTEVRLQADLLKEKETNNKWEFAI